MSICMEEGRDVDNLILHAVLREISENGGSPEDIRRSTQEVQRWALDLLHELEERTNGDRPVKGKGGRPQDTGQRRKDDQAAASRREHGALGPCRQVAAPPDGANGPGVRTRSPSRATWYRATFR